MCAVCVLRLKYILTLRIQSQGFRRRLQQLEMCVYIWWKEEEEDEVDSPQKKAQQRIFLCARFSIKKKYLSRKYSFFIQQQQENARTRKYIVISQRSSSLDNIILINFRNEEETAVFVSKNCSPANQATNIISLSHCLEKRQRCSQTGSRLSQFIFGQQQRFTYTARKWAARTWKIEERRKKDHLCNERVAWEV